jgi:SAM-dependent methyltransferase
VKEFADHFSGHAPDYSAYRPSYPASFIRRLAQSAPDHRLAWDVGTGNGQAALLLAAHFERVRATDASADQLRQALSHPRVDYQLGREDESGLADGAADLVCAAQAAHWFDHGRFHQEADRALRPGGLLAVWAYGLAIVDAEVDGLVRDLHRRLDPWWPPERRWVDEGYRGLPFPYPDLPTESWTMEGELDRADYLGYLGTWSALRRARRGGAGDPLAECAEELSAHWPREERRLVRWPLHLRWGHKPG